MIALGACTESDPVADPPPPPPPTTTTTEAPPPTLPPVAPYVALPGEPVPELKAMAGNALQAIGTYEVGGGTRDQALGRVATVVDAAVVDAAAALLQPDASSSIEVVYPQLGGLTDDAAAVMVVYRWRTITGTRESEETRTADVRLARTDTGWRVTALPSLGGGPPSDAPPPTAAAAAVLESQRIELSDTGRWDVEAGRIGDELLQVLLDLSEDHVLSVTVLATGHPREVFETALISNHTEGRGVDIWAVDGTPVLEQRQPGSTVESIVRRLLDAGVTEVGSPFDLDGPRDASFANVVHQDHLHIAFDG